MWSSRSEWRWVYRYHFEGQLKEIDIGPSARGSNRLAQRKALALYKLICDDIDPLAQRDQTEQLLAKIDNEGWVRAARDHCNPRRPRATCPSANSR